MLKVQLTPNVDGLLHWGDWVLLQSLFTEGVLSFNVNEAILGEETYAVTTSRNLVPILRNTFQVEPVSESESGVVRYGDKVRFVTYVNDTKVIDNK